MLWSVFNFVCATNVFKRHIYLISTGLFSVLVLENSFSTVLWAFPECISMYSVRVWTHFPLHTTLPETLIGLWQNNITNVMLAICLQCRWVEGIYG